MPVTSLSIKVQSYLIKVAIIKPHFSSILMVHLYNFEIKHYVKAQGWVVRSDVSNLRRLLFSASTPIVYYYEWYNNLDLFD